MSLLNVYNGTVTAGGTDGDLLTPENVIHSGSIVVEELTISNGAWVKLAVRCNEYYETEEADGRHVRISISDSDITWQLAPDNAGEAGAPEDAGDPLDITDQVDDTNTVFWIRGIAIADELPVNDETTTVSATGRVAAQ